MIGRAVHERVDAPNCHLPHPFQRQHPLALFADFDIDLDHFLLTELACGNAILRAIPGLLQQFQIFFVDNLGAMHQVVVVKRALWHFPQVAVAPH